MSNYIPKNPAIVSSLQHLDTSIVANSWVPTQEDLYDLSQIYDKVILHRTGLSQSNIPSQGQISTRSHSNPRSNCSIIKEKLREARNNNNVNSAQSTSRQIRPDVPLHKRENKPSKSCNEIDQIYPQQKSPSFNTSSKTYTSIHGKSPLSSKDKSINIPKQSSIKKKDKGPRTIEGKLQFDMSSVRSDTSLVWYEEEDSHMDCSIKGDSVRRNTSQIRSLPKHEELNFGKKLKGNFIKLSNGIIFSKQILSIVEE